MATLHCALLIGSRARALVDAPALTRRFSELLVPRNADAMLHALDGERSFAFALVDVDSPQGNVWLPMLAAHAKRPLVIFALHERQIGSSEAFALAKVGVARLLPSSVAPGALVAELDRELLAADSPVRHLVKELVGRVGLFELECALRNAAVDEALARCAGNRSQAAALLNVPRYVVQRALLERRETKHRSVDAAPRRRSVTSRVARL
jgi:hypothetical protein